MTTIDKIRAEIKKRLNWKRTIQTSYYMGCTDELNELLSFLDTLEEPASEDLEEAAEEYRRETCNEACKNGFLDNHPSPSIKTAFKAGAEWQARQLLQGSPMPEDTVIFQKGVEEGKRLMMEGAVAVEVVGEKRDLRLIDSTQRCLFDAKRGDWLKIIIVKEEEQ